MATSGSFNYNVNRNDIIRSALRRIGRLDAQETIPPEDVDTCAEMLNEMVKSWSNTFLGRQLWTTQKGFLFLQPSKVEYDIGPSGDHATRSYTEVAAQSTVAASKVVLPEGAWAAGQYIGMINTDTEIQWTTISSVSNSITAVLSDALSATVTTSGVIFIYTDKIERPVDINNMRIAYHEGWQDEVSLISKERYNNIYDKSQTGDPQRYAYEPRLTNSRVYFDYQPNDFHDVMEFDSRRPFEDFDAATDNPDFPQEWLRALKWNLASEIAVDYGTPKDRVAVIEKRAAAALVEIRAMYAASPRTSEPAYGRKARVR